MAPASACARALLRLPHPGKYLLFALLSLADLVMTWALIRHGRGQFYESNPVAAWCLRCHGWTGLAGFKAVAVLLCVALTAAIALRRPRAAGGVLALACAVTAGVVLYACYLRLACAAPLTRLRTAEEHSARIDAGMAHIPGYRRSLTRLAGELSCGRRTLAEAVARLEPAARAIPGLLSSLRTADGGRSARESLAVSLMCWSVLRAKAEPHSARQLARRLDADFQSAFGGPPPRRFGALLASLEAPRPARGAAGPATARSSGNGPRGGLPLQ
jgi:hypothetical protein